jgi:hypothetical protein
MATTPNISLDLLAANQNQKHVTANVSFRRLDALVQLAVIDRGLTAPPGSPADGDRYLVASSATGAWAGWDLNITAYQDGAWVRLAPKEGWVCWVADENIMLVYDGATWVDLTAAAFATGLGNGTYSLLGINGATADTTNRLSVNTAGVLLNRAADDITLKMNKDAAADDAAINLQTGFSTRALFGLLATDDLAFRTSPDGSTFYTMLTLDKDGDSATFGAKDLVACQTPNAAQMQFHVLEELVSGLSGASVDTSIDIPNGAIVFNVSERVVTTITGATSFSVGTAAEPSKFGSGLFVGSGGTNLGVIGPTAFYADTPIRLTAAGGNFSGGAVRVCIHYYLPQVPQS